MDMRTHGKDFERAYNDAKGKHGIRFVRSRVHTVDSVPGTNDVSVRYVDGDGQTVVEQFDMLILSVGLEVPQDLVDLAGRLDISLTPGNFLRHIQFLTGGDQPAGYLRLRCIPGTARHPPERGGRQCGGRGGR